MKLAFLDGDFDFTYECVVRDVGRFFGADEGGAGEAGAEQAFTRCGEAERTPEGGDGFSGAEDAEGGREGGQLFVIADTAGEGALVVFGDGAGHDGVIGFLDVVLRHEELVREGAVVRDDEEALGVLIEAADREEILPDELVLCASGNAAIVIPIRGRFDCCSGIMPTRSVMICRRGIGRGCIRRCSVADQVDDGGLPPVLARGQNARRLVKHIVLLLSIADLRAVEADAVLGGHLRARVLHHRAVHRHEGLPDGLFQITAGADAHIR